jgi:pimeloyl-ACP methyl ester carboxylesterase
MLEPLVLLPGMMCDARVFGPQIAEFSKTRATMVVPLTDGERIEEIASNILTVLPAKFALAGLSMGGIVAMEMLRRAPDRITRIALMDTNALAETPQSAAGYETFVVLARSGRLGEAMAQIIKPDYLAATPRRTDFLVLIQKMAEALGPELFVQQIRALQRRRDYQSVLRRCKVPATVICGEHDGLTPVKRHSFMAELIPYAELRVIEGAGHLPTLEKPADTTEALREWLAQPFVLQ